ICYNITYFFPCIFPIIFSYNSKKHYDEFANSGFFTVVREDNGKDTREEVCDVIANHFGLC
ncbi:MAG: hypothetical protein K6B38_13245, partial [Ruminococcus sp.]|nr:hypothetical protein [Ruminococcus sp.]